jgi:hypothetical protein
MIKVLTSRNSFFIALIIIGLTAASAISSSDSIIIEDFRKYSTNPLGEWETRKNADAAPLIYSISVVGGRKFLRATTEKSRKSTQIGKLVNHRSSGKTFVAWNINQYPYLSWDWRIHSLPQGGNERIDSRNDSAAGIYVIFRRTNIPFVGWNNQPVNWIKYVWSSTLPVGTVINTNRTSMGVTLFEGRYVVVASGPGELKKWITFKRNIAEDYRKFFGSAPRFNPSMVAILTDANDTQSLAVADYDNIRASRE